MGGCTLEKTEYPAGLFSHGALFIPQLKPDGEINVQRTIARAFDKLKQNHPKLIPVLYLWLTAPKLTIYREVGRQLGLTASGANARIVKAWEPFKIYLDECVRDEEAYTRIVLWEKLNES
jgi:hypothetical protein